MPIQRINPDLPTDAICIAVFSRGDGTFHWTLAVPDDSGYAVEFHATNRGSVYPSKPWTYQMRTTNLQKSLHASVIVIIGRLGDTTTEQLDELLKEIPMAVTEPAEANEQFTPQVWIRQAARALNSAGIIRCPDARALENEILSLAVDNDEPTVLGKPLKIHVATTST